MLKVVILSETERREVKSKDLLSFVMSMHPEEKQVLRLRTRAPLRTTNAVRDRVTSK